MKLNNLKDLFLDNLKDIYQAEKQMVVVMPAMVSAATSPDLREALQDHLRETEEHIIRLDKIFSILEMHPSGKLCKAMEGLIAEAEEIFSSTDDKMVLDASIIAAVQKIEHYEIASYGTIRTYAEVLEMEDIADLLEETLEEEKAADDILTDIAEEHVNEDADNS